MTIEARNRTLPDWFTRIRTHQTTLPRFQRFEAWSPANVAQLFNTILQDLPIGAMLILEVGDKEPFITRPIAGAPEHGDRVTENLLDGQQRLTALWRGLNNNYTHDTFFLVLDKDEESQAPFYVKPLPRWRRENDAERRPFWANDPVQLWQRNMIPLDVCGPGDEARNRLNEWVSKAVSDPDERANVKDEISKVREKLTTFNIPYLSLPVGTPPDVALDVFIKMNTSAVPLSAYDIVVAQVEAGTGQSLHDLVADTRKQCARIADFYDLEALTLAAGALLQGKPANNSTYLQAEFAGKLVANWDRYELGVERAAAFLAEERIFDIARLPTDVVIPVIVALWADAPDKLDAEGRARLILRRYMWRAFFTARYEQSTATRAFADYQELKAWIGDPPAPRPAIFDEAQYPLPEKSALLAAGWPKNKDRLARAILAVALRQGGLDLADGSAASRENLAKREYHHLFPVKHLERQNVEEREAYRSLNCALITWRTNRNISDKEPEQYLAQRRIEGDPDDLEVKERLASHLIPYEEMVAGDYQKFLDRRAELIEPVMKKLCGVDESEK